MRIELSIILVNWNGLEITRQCLKSIYEQTKNICFEIIVIDNASKDLSCKMIREEFPKVILVCNEENKGFAAANNQGINKSKGNFILLLNNDTIVLENAIEKTLFAAESNSKAAVMGCKVLNRDRTPQSSCFMFPSILNLIIAAAHLDTIFPKNKFFGRERYARSEWNEIKEVDVVAGCFMLVRRDAIEDTGTLDERFFMYGEETDWCMRFKKHGWKILFCPNGKIIHLGGESSKKIKGTMMLQLKGSILLFIKKHYSRLSYAAACIVISLYFLIRTPYHLVRDTTISRVCCKGTFLSLLGADYLCLKR